jgi:hypothetical protein
MRVILNSLKEYNDILAYDPGGTTGFARIRVSRERNTMEVYEIGEFHTTALLRVQLSSLNNKKTLVVYESIVISTRVATQQTVKIPIEVIGVINFLCDEYKIIRFDQKPAERLSSEAWYPNIHNIPSHSGSATRHGVVFARSKMIPRSEKFPKLLFDMKQLNRDFIKY